MDFYSFYMGKEFEAYQFLGAHGNGNGTVFRTFAPAAKGITVVGEFNNWEGTPMYKIGDGNFWECNIDNAMDGMMYKYRIYTNDGTYTDHCDPYGFAMELRPGSASKICWRNNTNIDDYFWMEKRNVGYDRPINIYEMHLGSWKKPGDDKEDWYTYEEVAKLLLPYLKENGYNYVEVMPLSEHPCDESWGYQNTGFFSPTARYGTPEGLAKFVEILHQNDIGVIMDFVPVHFAVDGYGLNYYDGTHLYEYPNADVGNSEWGSCNFMHSRGEVRSFLNSAAYFWLKEYHFDGLRMDAISNIIYWQGNAGRGVNGTAVNFIKELNEGLKKRMPSVMLIAEDSSAFPGVTKPVWENGLGFDYKWDLGWMNDTLDFMRSAPEYRESLYNKITFSMMYYYNERYLLPFSHDEVVHGKATILQKMNGQYDEKFPQGRLLYLYMYTHPGKKLNFMGNEIGQLREWDESREQDWDMLKYPNHDAFHHYIMKLNEIYLSNPALSENDFNNFGFMWTECNRPGDAVYAYVRRGGGKAVLTVLNFSDREQVYEYSGSEGRLLSTIIDTDYDIYGGSILTSELDGQKELSNSIKLAPFSGKMFEIGF